MRVAQHARRVCGQLNVVHAQLVDLASELLDGELWVGWRSPEQWLTRSAGITPGHARQVLRVARAAHTHPAVLAVLRSGELSLDLAALAVQVPEHCQEATARLAVLCSVPQLRTIVRAALASVPENRPVDVPAAQRERLEAWFDEDGEQPSLAEALADVAERSLGSVPASRHDRFRSYLHLHLDSPVPARFADGVPVPAWLHEQLGCDGRVSPVYVERGRPVSVGRSQPSVPAHTRRLVLARDTKCVVPWCTQQQWMDIHHIRHRGRLGGHDTDNLAALCPFHHRRHHRGELVISGDADVPFGLRFTDRYGHEMSAVLPPIPPAPGDQLPQPARPLLIPNDERLQRRAVWFPPPHEPVGGSQLAQPPPR